MDPRGEYTFIEETALNISLLTWKDSHDILGGKIQLNRNLKVGGNLEVGCLSDPPVLSAF